MRFWWNEHDGAAGMNDTGLVAGRKRRNLSREERGQALIEMAFALPILIVLLLGIVEVGRYAQLSIVVSNAARTGAIYGAQSLAAAGDWQGIQAAAQADANLGVDSSNTNKLTVISSPGLLPSNEVNPCRAIADTGSPLPYIVVRTNTPVQALFFSNTTFLIQGCAQMQVAQ